MTRDAVAAVVALGILGITALFAYGCGFVAGHRVATERAAAMARAVRSLRGGQR